MSKSKVIVISAAAAVAAAYWYLDVGSYLDIETLRASRSGLISWFEESPIEAIAMFATGYIAVTALSLPGATIMSLAGGAIFGLGVGAIVVLLSATMGATLAFLTARFLFKESFERKFGDRLAPIRDGVSRDGAYYLLTLRLVPAFPFFLINILMGLTPISVKTFFVISLVGMLPGSIVYVNAGSELAQVQSVADIMSLNLILSFALIGVMPLVLKKLVRPRK
jgi:uncharacterized membrane protein YdjX (TVP38/TMEM64 family)